MSGEGSPTTRWFVAVAERVGFPYILGDTFNGLMTTGDLFDYAPSFDEGTRQHEKIHQQDIAATVWRILSR